MINLLPPELKQSYRYGLGNVVLMRWVVTAVISLAGLGVIGTYGWLTLHQSTVSFDSQVAKTEASLKQAKLAETQKQVKDISNSFRLVVQVLSKEVLFSQLLKQMATVLPPGAYLTDLNIGKVQGALDISAKTTDYNTATQVQVNLADPSNKIFQKADIVSIVCDTKNATDPSHPCTVTLTALFAPNNPFLFINQKTGTH